jgi:hypothetical protein
MIGTEAPLSQSFVELGPVALFWGQILSIFCGVFLYGENSTYFTNFVGKFCQLSNVTKLKTITLFTTSNVIS